MPPPSKEDVLDLKVRRRIVKAVEENPGLHLRALAEKLDLALSTLEYHCYHLVKHHCLTSRQDGGYKAFYPAEGMDRRDKDILYLIRHEAPRRICGHLCLHPGSTPKDLKAVVKLSPATLSFHLKKLREAGITEEEPAGRTKKLFLADPERVAGVLVTYRGSFLDDAVDRFASAWLDLHPPTRKAASTPAQPRDADDAMEGEDAGATEGGEGDGATEGGEAADAAPAAAGDAADTPAVTLPGPAEEPARPSGLAARMDESRGQERD